MENADYTRDELDDEADTTITPNSNKPLEFRLPQITQDVDVALKNNYFDPWVFEEGSLNDTCNLKLLILEDPVNER